jgi:putative flippase GtrA
VPGGRATAVEFRRTAATDRRRSGTDRANSAKTGKRTLWTRATGARSAGLARFGLVGASGIVVNELAIAGLVSGLGLHYLVGYLLATQCSTLWNFAFIETWAFRAKSPANRRWHRFVMLMVVNNIANVLTAPLYVAFTSLLGINYLVSNILTLAIIFVGRFAVAERIWGGGGAVATGAVVSIGLPDADADVGADASEPPAQAGAVAPTEGDDAFHDEIVELRARVAKLEAERIQLVSELSAALESPVAPGPPPGPMVSPPRRGRRAQQAGGQHRTRSAKWFPAG